MGISELQKRSWQVSEDHGFHEAMLALPPKTLATYLKLLLTIGELSEAAEEIRKGRSFTEVYYTHGEQGSRGTTALQYLIEVETLEGKVASFESPLPPTEEEEGRFKQCCTSVGKPEGFGVELADALIRLCDLAEDVGVDLSAMARLKESYNRTREFMHGKTA